MWFWMAIGCQGTYGGMSHIATLDNRMGVLVHRGGV